MIRSGALARHEPVASDLPGLEQLLDPLAVAGGDGRPQRLDLLDQASTSGSTSARLSRKMSRHMTGLEAATRVVSRRLGVGSAPQPLDHVAGDRAQRGRQRVGRHVRQVASGAEHAIVQLGVHAHRLGAQRRPEALDGGDGLLAAVARSDRGRSASLRTAAGWRRRGRPVRSRRWGGRRRTRPAAAWARRRRWRSLSREPTSMTMASGSSAGAISAAISPRLRTGVARTTSAAPRAASAADGADAIDDPQRLRALQLLARSGSRRPPR